MNIDLLDFNYSKRIDKEWALVTAGGKDNFNSMTISWGSIGTLWNKTIATIYIRPSRYTYKFLNDNEYFTISFYDKSFKKDLGIIGSKSGRDIDKLSLTKLNPRFLDNGITYNEASLTLICKKIYTSSFDKNALPKEIIEKDYSGSDKDNIHYMFMGEVVDII